VPGVGVSVSGDPSDTVHNGVRSLTHRRWTVKSDEVLQRARGLARDKSHPQVTNAHLLLALFEADTFVSLYLRRLGSEPERALSRATDTLAGLPTAVGPDWSSGDGEPPVGDELHAALQRAANWAEELDDEYVSTESLLLGLAGGDDDVALTLQAAGVGRGGWQAVIRHRREVWQRQVQRRPRTPGFDGSAREVVVEATRLAEATGAAVEPAHLVLALLNRTPRVGALLAALDMDPTAVRLAAARLADQAGPVAPDVAVPVVSGSVVSAIVAARQLAADAGASQVGVLPLLRALARDPSAGVAADPTGREAGVAELLRGLDEMLGVLTDRVREPMTRLTSAVMAQQRAMQQSDLETAARLLHGDIPALRQQLEAMGEAEAAVVGLLEDDSAPSSADAAAMESPQWSVPADTYQRFLAALDTARARHLSGTLLRWLGALDQPPGATIALAGFCATVHDGRVTGREAARAAGRLALLGLVERDEDAVRLTAAGLRCLENRGGDPEATG
jgi:hypothetical protein